MKIFKTNLCQSNENILKSSLDNNIKELENFVNNELPKIQKSNNSALSALEQIAINIKAMINKK